MSASRPSDCLLVLLLDLQPLQPPSLAALCRNLSATEQCLLYSVFVDLPPAVMGDMEAQQTSRVLIDVAADARETLELDSIGFGRAIPVRHAHTAAKAVLAQLAKEDAMRIVLSLASEGSLSSAERTRLVLQHVLASRTLPAPIELRKSALESILPLAATTPR